MKTIIAITALFGAISCRPSAEILNYQADSQIHTQNGMAGVAVEGQYSYEGPDGKTYSLKYRADDNGFVAEGDHLPVAPEVPASSPVVAEDSVAAVVGEETVAPASDSATAEEPSGPTVAKAEAPAVDLNIVETKTVVADSPAEDKTVAAAKANAEADASDSVDVVAADFPGGETPQGITADQPFAAAVPAFSLTAPAFFTAPVAVISQNDATNYPAGTGPLPEVKFISTVVSQPFPVQPFYGAPLPPIAYGRFETPKAADPNFLPASTSDLVVPQFKITAQIPAIPAGYAHYPFYV